MIAFLRLHSVIPTWALLLLGLATLNLVGLADENSNPPVGQLQIEFNVPPEHQPPLITADGDYTYLIARVTAYQANPQRQLTVVSVGYWDLGNLGNRNPIDVVVNESEKYLEAYFEISRSDLEKLRLKRVKEDKTSVYEVEAGAYDVKVKEEVELKPNWVKGMTTLQVECTCHSQCAVPQTASTGEFGATASWAFPPSGDGGASQALAFNLPALPKSDPAPYQPNSLSRNSGTARFSAGTDTVLQNGAIRQMLHAGVLADVQLLNGQQGYVVKFYPRGSIGTKDGATGLYPVNGDPYFEATVVNPDPTPDGRLKLIQVDRSTGTPTSREWIYANYQQNGKEYWVKTGSHEGRVFTRETVEREYQLGGSFPKFSQVRTVEMAGSEDPTLVVTSRNKETYGWLSEIEPILLEETVGFGQTGARTSSWEYYSDKAVPATYGRLKATRTPIGGWTQYFYEAGTGTNVTREVTCFGNAAFGDAANARITTTTSTTLMDNVGAKTVRRTEEKLLGTLVRLQQWTRRTLADGAAEEVTEEYLPDGLKSITRMIYNGVNGGPGKYRLRFRQNPDGTVERYIYTPDSNSAASWSAVRESGVGNENAVSEGRRTIWHYNSSGELDHEKAVDIVTGVQIAEKKAAPGYIDNLGRIQRWIYDGDEADFSETSYGCCSGNSERTRGGVTQQYTHDDAGRMIGTIATIGSRTLVTGYIYNGLSIKRTTQIDGTSRVVSETISDLAGRVTIVKQIAGNATNFELVQSISTRDVLPGGGERVVIQNTDGSTDVEETQADGRLKRSIKRQGWATELTDQFEYGVHSERGGGEWEKKVENTSQWVKTFKGLNGIQIKQERPAFGGQEVAIASTYTDAAGRTIKTVPAIGAATFLTYSAIGNLFESIVDIDNSGTPTPPDRLSRIAITPVASVTLGGQLFGPGVLETNSVLNESGNEVVNLRVWHSFDERATATETYNLVTSSFKSKAINGAWTVTTMNPDGTRAIESYEDGLLAEVTTYSADSDVPLMHTLSTYDSRGRCTTKTERRHVDGGEFDVKTAFTYFDSAQVRSVRNSYDESVNGVGTVYTRDVEGRELTVQLADGSMRTTSYNDLAGTIQVNGSQTFTKQIQNDAFGRRVELKTWHNVSANLGGASTKWLYDPSTGLLKEKQYADGSRTRYEYDKVSRPTKRTSARGIQTLYSYTAADQLEAVQYSDGTPGVTYVYDRNGNLLSAGEYRYKYDPVTLFQTSEEILLPGAPENEERVIRRKRDNLLRDSGLILQAGESKELETTWSYDGAGRVATVAADGAVFHYNYLEGRPHLVASIQGPVHSIYNEWDSLRDTLKTKDNRRNLGMSGVVAKYTYTVNNLGQRTAVRTGGEIYGADSHSEWDWSYDATGAAILAHNINSQALNESFLYDDVGNRKWSSTGGEAILPGDLSADPAGEGVTKYTANTLNQYSKVEEGPAVQPVFDAEGNLTDDGTYVYVWDAENRLVALLRKVDMQPLATYRYDYLGRRTGKVTTSNAPQGVSNIAFVYDGANLIGEYSWSGTEWDLRATNVWGLDLSGSPSALGGIGGLLMRSAGSSALYYCYDGCGNVSALLGRDGACLGRYEYGVFGNVIAADAALVDKNPFEFSTQYKDRESGLNCFSFRFYNARHGCWLSRDPIEENGGVNLYAYVYNDPINFLDRFGLAPTGQPRVCEYFSNVKIDRFVVSPAHATGISSDGDPDTLGATLAVSYQTGIMSCPERGLASITWLETADFKEGTDQAAIFRKKYKGIKQNVPFDVTADTELFTANKGGKHWVERPFAGGDNSTTFGSIVDPQRSVTGNWLMNRWDITFSSSAQCNQEAAKKNMSNYIQSFKVEAWVILNNPHPFKGRWLTGKAQLWSISVNGDKKLVGAPLILNHGKVNLDEVPGAKTWGFKF